MKVDIDRIKQIILSEREDVYKEMNLDAFKELNIKSFAYGKVSGELLAYDKVLSFISEMEEFRNRREELNEIGELDD